MLVGREAELDRLGAALAAAAARRGGALVLRGSAGIGKSALLGRGVADAAEAGWRILRAVGLQAEIAVPYSGLLRLLLPVAGENAAGFLLGDDPGTTEEQPQVRHYRASVAVLDLLDDGEPTLLVVDDAQWLDRDSWEVLTFVARRLADTSILLLPAMRDGAATTRRLTGSGLPELAVGPVGDEAADRIVRSVAPGLPVALRIRVREEAAGNPLGLRELAAAAARAGEAVLLPAGLPLPDRLATTYLTLVGELPERTRYVLRVAALDDGDEIDEILRAADADAADLAPAIAATLAEPIAGTLLFRHPLMRSALAGATPDDERRRIHAALAEAVHAPDRRTLHLAEAADAPDDDLAEAMARLALASHGRGAVGSAVSAWERAAQLSTSPSSRTGWLFRAIDAAFEIGDVATVLRLDDLIDTDMLGERDRVWLTLLREENAGRGLVVEERLRTYVGAAESLRASGRPDEAFDLFQRVMLRLYLTNLSPAGSAAVVGFVERTGLDARDPRAATLLGSAAPIQQGRAFVASLPRHVRRTDLDPLSQVKLAWTAVSLGALAPAADLLERAVDRCRVEQRVGTLTQALVTLAACRVVGGNARAAERAASEAGRLADESAQPRWLANTGLLHGVAIALRGEHETTIRDADRVEERLRSSPAFPLRCLVNLARGTAALAAGDPEAAESHLAPAFDPADPAYHPSARFWLLPTYAEAAHLAGRHAELRALLDELEPVERECGSPLLSAGITLGRALLRIEDYPSGPAPGALAGWPFQKARADHAYGAHLRRGGRNADARPFLHAALGVFEALGAEAWAERSRRELRAAGETVRPTGTALDLLSPQEQQVAELAAQGLSNREIGNRLLLSPRTVGSHLYRIFPKLGIAARGELGHALGLAVTAS